MEGIPYVCDTDQKHQPIDPSTHSRGRDRYPEQRELQRLGVHEGELELRDDLLDLPRIVVGHPGHGLARRIAVLPVQAAQPAEAQPRHEGGIGEEAQQRALGQQLLRWSVENRPHGLRERVLRPPERLDQVAGHIFHGCRSVCGVPSSSDSQTVTAG